MSDFKLRLALPEDAYALSAIGSATFLESYTELIPRADLISHCYNQHSVEIYRGFLTAKDIRFCCWIAEFAETGAPIGYAVTCPPDLPVAYAPSDIELKRIYVFSKYHGTGAGRMLNQAVDAHAKAIGAKHILLGTYEANHRAIAFYKREGYGKIGERQFQVGDRLFDDIVMAKTL
jgi:ribosomal protein S18 acetylase RimI-like enzyme